MMEATEEKKIKGEEHLEEMKVYYKETGSLNRVADKTVRAHPELGSLTGRSVMKVFRKHGVKIKSNRQRHNKNVYYKKAR